jgi:hypothetical protein
VKYKFECGCIRADYVKTYVNGTANRRYCPEHPDKYAVGKVFTCQNCGVEYHRSMHSNGSQRVWCDKCGPVVKNREQASAKLSGAANNRWNTDDEIAMIMQMDPERRAMYRQGIVLRENWANLDRERIYQAAGV